MTPPQRAGLRATTIHDLNPLHHPEWCTPRTIAMHRRKDSDAVKACDVVFTNSQFTADDATASLGIEAERLVVARPGVGRGFRPDGERATFDRPFVLGVGTLEPRKNLERLVEAWRLLAGDHRLVLAGGSGWGEQPGLDDPGIVLPGYVPEEELPALYRGADVYVYPSLFEGFGIPVVEAMACGTPVVASSHPSLDEACGDAAVRVDPRDPESIAAGISEALARRDELARAGIEHAARFSWRGDRQHHAGGARRESQEMKVGFDVSPLVQTGAGTARHVRGLLAALEGRRELELHPLSFGGRGQTATIAARHSLVSGGNRSRSARSRRSPLHDDAGSGARPSARRRHRPRRRAPPLPGIVPGLAPAYRAARPPAGRSHGGRDRRRLRLHARRAGAAPRGLRRSRSRRSERRRLGVRPERACRERELRARRRHARATQEPRPSGSGSAAGGRRVACRRRLGVGRRQRAGLGSVGPATTMLAELYRGARCLVFPSVYEGFGIPILEAMACGTPVVTSSGGATEEVAGGAAVLVDPLDVEAIAAGIAEAHDRRSRARGARAGTRAGVHLAARGGRARGALAGARMSEPLVVVDADVLGRSRTGDEKYVLNLLRELPSPAAAAGLRIAAVTRRPDLVPAGIEPIELGTRSQELRMAWTLPRLLRGAGAALVHTQYALPVRSPCPGVVTIHDLSFERDPTLMNRARP